jgi:hypothetical protein
MAAPDRPPGHGAARRRHASWPRSDTRRATSARPLVAREHAHGPPGHVLAFGWPRPSHAGAYARAAARVKPLAGTGSDTGLAGATSVAWAAAGSAGFPFSAHFSDLDADSGSVRPLGVRFFSSFHLHQLKHIYISLHATVPWGGRLRPKKDGIFP